MSPVSGARRALHRRVLVALADLWVPAVPRSTDPYGYWAGSGSAWGAPAGVLEALADLPPDDRADLERLLDVLVAAGVGLLPGRLGQGLLPLLQREPTGEVARGVRLLRTLMLVQAYGRPQAGGRHPVWDEIGWPGPPVHRTPPDDALPLHEPGPGPVHLDADVVVVGSGAGGGVVAGLLAQGGKDVVVCEAAGPLPTDDLPRDELTAYRSLYWRAGYQPVQEGTCMTISGATLGGGTTVNWTNWVRTPQVVRQQWADDHGVEGVDGPGFDACLDSVAARVNATDAASVPNGPNIALRDGADARGLDWHAAVRNTDPDRYDEACAGAMGFVDRSGAKRSTLVTYLRDATDAGARVLAGAHVERVLVEQGRAVGVAGTLTRPDGSRSPLEVRARTVVVAGGAYETPALLLRSGLGGPAVGENLHLHPVVQVPGMYPRDLEPWLGAPHAVVLDHFARWGPGEDGWGFLVESTHFGSGSAAATVPWLDGAQHKAAVARVGQMASLLGQPRDRSKGRVTLDDRGEAVISYPLDDPHDHATLRRAVREVALLHVAAGADTVWDLAAGMAPWRRGDDLSGWLEKADQQPFGPGGRMTYSAHQMGTARMGTDRATSVTDPWGAVHGVPGLWVADASLFPTATAANPMATTMALAARTAAAITG